MTCGVLEVSGNVVRDRLRAKAMAERIPLHVDVEIIATCNYKCVHCYIAPCAAREDVMSVENAQRIFGMLAHAGTMSVLLTGGEVFSHRDFREIYLAAKRSGLFVYINTNAYFISERWADFLAEWPPKTVSISLYGATPETYERLTGIPNSYDRCLRAIDLLLDRGVPIELKCPAMTITAGELPLMKRFAEERGVSFRYDTSVMPQEGGSVTPLKLQLAPEEVLALDGTMDPNLEQFGRFASDRVGQAMGPSVYRCGAGRTGFAVNVHGGVSTCLTSRQVVGNLLEDGFENVWAALAGKVDRRFPDGHPCATCRFRAICVGCPATVEQLTGLPEGYVQHYCRITHLRAHATGLHATGIPRTMVEGIPASVTTVRREAVRALPVLN
jgi:radical SAM protein with 4Fe4S-binding SPASM domain